MVEKDQDGALFDEQEWKNKYVELNDAEHILTLLVLLHCTTRVTYCAHLLLNVCVGRSFVLKYI